MVQCFNEIGLRNLSSQPADFAKLVREGMEDIVSKLY